MPLRQLLRAANTDTSLAVTPDDVERRRLEEEVLTELASHPTAVYIRGLEDECEGYREALQVRTRTHSPLTRAAADCLTLCVFRQSETKRTRDQRVALESKDRIVAKLREQLQSFSRGRAGSRAGSAGSSMRQTMPQLHSSMRAESAMG